jgi:CheY-specific phosphatase CheX
MTPSAHKPDLRCIAESACTQVLRNLLSLPVTAENFAAHAERSPLADAIRCSVPLEGKRISGCVHLELPRGIVVRAAQLLTGVEDGSAGNLDAAQDDAAGEIANMVAGAVAGRLGAEGYFCGLGIPSVSRGTRPSGQNKPGTDYARADLICAGHCLSIQLECRYWLHGP